MNTFKVCMVIALAALATAEPPSGYSYSRPSGGGGGGYSSGGYSSGGSLGGGYSGGGGGGGYTAVSTGYQTSEGASVDPQLLEQVRQILLKEEQSSGSIGGGGGGYPSAPSSSYGAPSSSYGVPSSSYGVPSYSSGRVVGIDLEGIRQAIQVAQYNQISHGQVGGGGGYPSGPSSSYGAPSIPSGSYGAPF
ncbi:pro-resilin [Chrysoperla carnea]|uniref:pro-resilin n=1 Tax=Chrysoperla carnea TaxID=189513 RepID=UPI001D06CD17|nr:pro-resilin [Chrysoperla carnea]